MNGPETNSPIVYIVDDDADVRESLNLLLASAGFRVQDFSSAEEFLEHGVPPLDAPRCLLLDLRMPGLSGLGLQQRLRENSIRIPIVFLTGFGDVAVAVEALKHGAMDFVLKPYHFATLLAKIQQALDVDVQQVAENRRRHGTKDRLASLSKRELDVYRILVDGKNNKEIASMLGIGIPTVTKHRIKIFQKLRVRTLVELIKLSPNHFETPH
jgi:FixJ family two-component response regulator